MTKLHLNFDIKPKLILWIVTAVCILCLGLQYFQRDDAVSIFTVAGTVIVPFQEGVNQVGSAAYEAVQEKVTKDELNEQIAQLESQVADLNLTIDKLKYSAEENINLRQLLSMKESYPDYEMTGASVIGTDGVNWFSRFTINVGSANGIETDMNVVNQDGLVGIVTSVGLNYSVVTSIVESGMSVSAAAKNSQYNCFVSGGIDSESTRMLALTNASIDFDATADSTLVTSQVSDKYLPGLVVGYVQEIHVNDDNLTRSGTVRTAVDFTRISNVMVITTTKADLLGMEE